MRLVAAMSGGVDSAVAAARAVDAGHEIVGVHLALARGQHSGCCTPEDARDARRAADLLEIPFYVWDLADRFATDVVEDFVSSYAAGETPNPCLRCNERIKFSAVLDRAVALGFDGIVTGHHARLRDGVLRRSADPGKDQSYVLGTLTAVQLAHAHFPLGDSTKTQVRAEAAARGLGVAAKPDSHDICFVGKGRTAAWLRDRLGPEPGPILDRAGAEVGRHDGAYAFTVGQRRGVPIGGGTVDPRYVLAVSPVTKTVVVGPAAALDVLVLDTGPGTYGGGDRRCEVQVRAHGDPVPAQVTRRGDGGWRLLLDRPVRGAAPGQAAVLYEPDPRGDRVLGGARIQSTAPSWESSQVLTSSP